MNRAWMIRAEQRLTQLEQQVRDLKARVALLEQTPIDVPIVADVPKRGPGRPRKVQEAAA